MPKSPPMAKTNHKNNTYYANKSPKIEPGSPQRGFTTVSLGGLMIRFSLLAMFLFLVSCGGLNNRHDFTSERFKFDSEEIIESPELESELKAALVSVLDNLANQQGDDGSWFIEGGSKSDSIVTTAFVLRAFIRNGFDTVRMHNEKEHPYDDRVLAGINWLKKQQNTDGSFGDINKELTTALVIVTSRESYEFSQWDYIQKAFYYLLERQIRDDSHWVYGSGWARSERDYKDRIVDIFTTQLCIEAIMANDNRYDRGESHLGIKELVTSMIAISEKKGFTDKWSVNKRRFVGGEKSKISASMCLYYLDSKDPALIPYIDGAIKELNLSLQADLFKNWNLVNLIQISDGVMSNRLLYYVEFLLDKMGPNDFLSNYGNCDLSGINCNDLIRTSLLVLTLADIINKRIEKRQYTKRYDASSQNLKKMLINE